MRPTSTWKDPLRNLKTILFAESPKLFNYVFSWLKDRCGLWESTPRVSPLCGEMTNGMHESKGHMGFGEQIMKGDSRK